MPYLQGLQGITSKFPFLWERVDKGQGSAPGDALSIRVAEGAP